MFCSSERQVTCSRHQLWKYKENVQLVILLVNAIRFHNVRLTPMRSGGKRIEIQAFQLFWTWPLSLKNPPPQKKEDSVYWEVIYFLLIHSKNFQMSFEVVNVWKVIEKWRSLSEYNFAFLVFFLGFWPSFSNCCRLPEVKSTSNQLCN